MELKGIDLSKLEPCEYREYNQDSPWCVGAYLATDDSEDIDFHHLILKSDKCATEWVFEVRPIQEKKTRPMTAQEIAMLPRGTAFVNGDGDEVYNTSVVGYSDGSVWFEFDEAMTFKGYILPNKTELRKFEVEA